MCKSGAGSARAFSAFSRPELSFREGKNRELREQEFPREEAMFPLRSESGTSVAFYPLERLENGTTRVETGGWSVAPT